VEVCATIKSVKYLYKYVYKGYDCATIDVRDAAAPVVPETHNEVKNFLDARWVGAAEAAWRIYGMKMHHQSHPIIRLQVHTEDHQTVIFAPDQDLRQCLAAAANRKTTLTGWFDLNNVDATAQEFLYTEIPEHFIFEKGAWRRRKQKGDKVIGRMFAVNVKDSER
jgi:hypothetical protein